VRIVHFLNHTRRANGHVEIAVDLACEQAAQGHEVALVSGPGDFDQCLRENGVTFFEIPNVEGKRGLLSMAISLTRFTRKFRTDVVNAHMVKAALIARTVQLQSQFHLVTTVHNSFDKQSTLMRVGDRVIAVSDAVKEEMITKGVPARKLRTVRNGTINGKRRPRAPSRLRELKHPNITTVCGLHPRKGVSELIDAFTIVAESFPTAHLYVVGDGPQRAELQAKASKTRISENIHLLGYEKDPREILASSDIFVLASHADPCPLVISEARQMGCAIVATNVGGIPELLSFGKIGMLVPQQNPAALAAALSSLLNDRTLREHYASEARSNLAECFVERMASETTAVYSELV
jgi:glycosyltransferase involved in cell wall biosynthesis